MEDPEILVLLSPHLEILDLQIQSLEAKNLPPFSPRSQDLEFQDLQTQDLVLEVLMTPVQEVEALPEVISFVLRDLYIFNFCISRNIFPLLHKRSKILIYSQLTSQKEIITKGTEESF